MSRGREGLEFKTPYPIDQEWLLPLLCLYLNRLWGKGSWNGVEGVSGGDGRRMRGESNLKRCFASKIRSHILEYFS